MDDDVTHIAIDVLLGKLEGDLESCTTMVTHCCRNVDDVVRAKSDILNLLKNVVKYFDYSAGLFYIGNQLVRRGRELAKFVAVEVSLVVLVTSPLDLANVAKELFVASAPLGLRAFLIANYFTLAPDKKNQESYSTKLAEIEHSLMIN
jgi:hypothetical protein